MSGWDILLRCVVSAFGAMVFLRIVAAEMESLIRSQDRLERALRRARERRRKAGEALQQKAAKAA